MIICGKRFGRTTWHRCFLYMLAGYIIGLLLNTAYVNWSHKRPVCVELHSNYLRVNSKGMDGTWHSQPSRLTNIYVGMLSAGKYITNRVQRSLDTWVQKGGWKVEAFADADLSVLSVPPGLDFNIVTLPSVDDTAYPPQKKSFMMIRHMYDNYIDDYDWFLRVDDDVYIDYDRLSRLLSKINSSMPVFLGTPGFGIDNDDGMEPGMYYLMGGPGMIFSRGLLLRLRSYLSHCVRHMYSPHEDIELGRCVWKHVKSAKIPIAWETIALFYQQYEKETGNVVNVEMDDLTPQRTEKTVSYHAVKSKELLYQLHKTVLQRKIAVLLNKTASLQQEMNSMNAMLRLDQITDISPKSSLSLLPLILGSDKELSKLERLSDAQLRLAWPEGTSWQPVTPLIPRITLQIPWINWDKYYRHQTVYGVPMRGNTVREQQALYSYLSEIHANALALHCPKAFPKNSHFSNGYLKVTPGNGVFLAVTYEAYVNGGVQHCVISGQVTYTTTLIQEKDVVLIDHPKLDINRNSECTSPGIANFLRSAGRNNLDTPPCSLLVPPSRVVIIVPLQGRYRTLEYFMERYEKNYLTPISHQTGVFSDPNTPKVQLVIVLIKNNEKGDDIGLSDASSNLLQGYQKIHGSDLLRYHVTTGRDGIFSRGAGLQVGSMIAQPNDVLLFMDIDMIVTPSMVLQCHRIASKGSVAWYPISYSQYDPDTLCLDRGFTGNADSYNGFDPAVASREKLREVIKSSPLVLSENRGFWRDFGFGIACLYKSDFVKAGGFDLSIEGWGEEDIRMYHALLKSGVDVFRSQQADLIHIFHPKYCEKLTGEQARACLITKASHYASQQCLAKTFMRRKRK